MQKYLYTKDYDHLIRSFQKTQCFERQRSLEKQVETCESPQFNEENSQQSTFSREPPHQTIYSKSMERHTHLWKGVSEWQTYKCRSGRLVCSFGPCFRRWQRVRRWPQKAIIGPAWTMIPQKIQAEFFLGGTGIKSNHSWLSGRKNLPSFQ